MKTKKAVCNRWYLEEGVKKCPYQDTTGCVSTADYYICGMLAKTLTQPASAILTGWQCPRCLQIHSPFKLSCDCPPRVTAQTTQA